MTRHLLPVALIQERNHGDAEANLAIIESRVAEAAAQGAKLVLLQELHNGAYFCQHESVDEFDLAEPIPGPSTERLGALAKQHGVVLVASLFERRAAGLYHNTAVVFEKDGRLLGKYRKMHIPDDPGFYEKFYFTPGDLGFAPIDTSVGRLGVLVCWDQWYPEAARLMALAGAELLLYPTAIGWDPDDQQPEQERQRDAWAPAIAAMQWPTGCRYCRATAWGMSLRRWAPRASSSGATAMCWGRRANSSPKPARSRRCWCAMSICSAASMCGASGRSCAIAASMRMAICSSVTSTDRMPVEVREVREADIPAITAIYAEQVAGVNSYEYSAPSSDEMRTRVRATVDAGYPYLVAERDAAVVGYAYAGAYRARAGYRWTVENSIYLASDMQGRGIGKALLGELIARCEQRGYRQMIAVIGDAENQASRRLHERFGFRTVGVFTGIGRKHGRWLDGLQMQRPLGTGDTAPPSDE